MKKTLLSSLLLLSSLTTHNLMADELSPIFQNKGSVLFTDDFSKGEVSPQYKIGQNTQWEVKDGYLIGKPASKEYQESKKDHNGVSPLLYVPMPKQNVVLTLDIMFDEKAAGGMVEFGHKVSKVNFSKGSMSVNGGKTKSSQKFSPKAGTWYSFIGELSENELVVTIDGIPTLYVQDDHLKNNKKSIVLRGPKQGSISFDNIKLYEATGTQSKWDSTKSELAKNVSATPKKNKKNKKKS